MPLLPVAFYGLEVPPGDILIPAAPDFPATFRITMAALDPSAPAELDEENGITIPRATLKLIRQPIEGPDADDDSDDEEYMRALLGGSDSEDSEDEDEDEEELAGPSDPAKSKKAKKAAAIAELLASIDAEASDEDMEDVPASKADKKGKAKAKAVTADEDSEEEEDSEDDDDEEDLEIEEFVICTLDPEKNFQQTIDITIAEDEQVFFKVTGTHAIHLSGNYVVPDDQGHNHHHEVYDSEDDEEDEDYDLSPDEDELELEDDDESDDLDGLEDPRITELDDEEEAPKLVSKSEKKGKNKRAAEEDLETETLDDLIEKASKPTEAAAGEKLSKKQLKKLKNNKGEAVATEATEAAPVKGDKKVQFAKNLEQGPTGSTPEKKAAETGVRVVQGVKIDDKKVGTGRACKKGDRVGMRYIGKLTDNKVFDSNKKGKPFTFKLGTGEVIKGWDIGVAGMCVGGERRITVPSNLAYGAKGVPGIPPNSTLIFDIKCLEIK